MPTRTGSINVANITPEMEGDILDNSYFQHQHWEKPTFRSGYVVTVLKWELVGKIVGHTYGYLGEEVADVEMIYGNVWPEVPVTALKPYNEVTHEKSIQNDFTFGEARDTRSLLLQQGDIDVPQSIGIPRLHDFKWID